MDVIVEKLNNDKHLIFALPCEQSENRLLLHQYLENTYPNLKKTSLMSKIYYGGFFMTLKTCYECDYKRVPLNKYHYGSMESNVDECRSGFCPKCDKLNIWEPNYDDWDDIIKLESNNMIIMGDFITNKRPSHAITPDTPISLEVVNKILDGKTGFFIEPPNKSNPKIKSFSKKQLTEYVDAHIKDKTYVEVVTFDGN